MLMTMDPDIQKNLEHLSAYDMLKELHCMYNRQIRNFFRPCENSTRTNKKKGSLKEYDGFVQNYNMHSMGKTVTELHAMLKLHEQTLPPKEVAPALHAIRAGRIQKNKRRNNIRPLRGIKGKAKQSWDMH
ncbi:hypothetical protein Tco_0320182 [Tanacetum coccineum]